MDIEEAKKMQGIEFTYVFGDGDTVPSYVKKFDPEVGLTCLSLDTETKNGWKPTDEDVLEADGTFCVVGAPANDLPECLRILAVIKESGSFSSSGPGYFSGCVFS